ncbi:MAG: hypothetical protein JXR46_03865 [Calditrichaceae bacterium]|nr:hypothetical protein [Calditrichaceae bacterium]MBN2708162.1 hypothetical protein [Calditrichaceae bacterium]RQV97160.1 MAG: hypothetical protein EH224_02205 [Calditrichota bacterium]
MNALIIFIGMIILLMIIYFIFNWEKKSDINIGNFLIIGITLIVLIHYAYDTNRMANETNRMVNENKRMADIQSKMYFCPRADFKVIAEVKNDSSITVIFIYTNSTDFYIDIYTEVNLICFKDTLDINSDLFNGERKKTIPPHSRRTNRFGISNNLLKDTHRTVKDLYKLKNNDEALIMNVKYTLKNEFIGKNTYQERIVESSYKYNFKTNGWDENYK